MSKKVAVYCRISDDRDGLGLGVERQQKDCVGLAKARGWDNIEVFTDNDISAFNGKKRPSYIEMMARIKAGEFEVLVAYASDRLHRSPRELEDFIDICNQRKLEILTVQAGDINLSTADGRTHARILGAFARGESEKTSSRIKRKALEKAMNGEPWSTGHRPFGYQANGLDINIEEAEAIAEVAQRFLAGESLNSLCRWLNEVGFNSPANKPFRTKALRDILFSARISGRRSYYGEIVAIAKWPAIISIEESDAIRAVFNSRTRLTPIARKNLLSGILICGECGKKLVSHNKEGRSRYICRKDAVSGIGCGGVFITGDLVEDFIVQAVLTRLNSPAVEASIKSAKANPKGLAIHKELASIEDKLIEQAEMLASNEFSRSEFNAGRKVILARKEKLETSLAQQRGAVMFDSILATPELIINKWSNLNLDRQRAVLKSVLESVQVKRIVVKGYGFDSARLTPIWKY